MERDRYGWWLLFVLAGWLLMASYVSSSFPFVGPDEPRYSQVARQMFESGDWITPRLGMNPWFEKPVLLYWLMAVSFWIFGVTELAARLPSIAAAMAGTCFIFLMVSKSSGKKQAFVSACLWMTSLFFIGFSHAATFDMLLTACVTAGMYFFFRFEAEHRSIYLYALYFCCGLGILAKGFAAPILIGLPILLFLVVEGRWKEIPKLRPFTGALTVAATTAIWFLPVSLTHGLRFWNEFVYQHHFVRYTSSHFHTSGGYFYYIPVLLLGAYPWTIAPLLGMPVRSVDPAALKRFSLCWLLSILLFFSFSQSKLPGYILPAAPAFFVLSGFSMMDFLENGKKGARWIILILILNLVVTAGLLLEFQNYKQYLQGAGIMLAVIAGCVLLSTIFCLKKKYTAALVAYSLIVFAAIYLFVWDFVPKSEWAESKKLALGVNPLLRGNRKLLLYNIYSFDMVFYTNGRVALTPSGYFVDVHNAHQLYEYVKQNKETFVLVGNEELPWMEKFSLWKVTTITTGKERSVVELEAL